MKPNSRMNNRRTRKGGGIMTAIKKPIYGSKSPVYKLDVSESIAFDKNKYEIAGLISYDVGEFSAIRAQSFIDQYLKKDIIEHALKHYSNAAKIVGYKVVHRKSVYKPSVYIGREQPGKCMPVQCPGVLCPGSYTLIGLVLRSIQGTAGTRRLTMSRTTKSKTH